MDCLITKLKGVVNNDNLPILGTVMFPSKGSSSRVFTVEYSEASRIQIVGNGNFLDGQGVSIGKTVNIPANTSTDLTLSSGEFNVRFYNADKLKTLNGVTSIDVTSTEYIFKIEDLSVLETSCKSLQQFQAKGCQVNGDISSLIYSEHIIRILMNGIVGLSSFYGEVDRVVPTKTYLNLAPATVQELTGDIKYFQDWSPTATGKITFYWRGTKISGELTTLLDTIAAKGQNLVMDAWPNTITTLGGEATTATQQSFKFNGSMDNPTEEDTARGWQIANDTNT